MSKHDHNGLRQEEEQAEDAAVDAAMTRWANAMIVMDTAMRECFRAGKARRPEAMPRAIEAAVKAWLEHRNYDYPEDLEQYDRDSMLRAIEAALDVLYAGEAEEN